MALEFGAHNPFLFIILTADRGHLIYLHIVPYNSLILLHKLRESIASVYKGLSDACGCFACGPGFASIQSDLGHLGRLGQFEKSFYVGFLFLFGNKKGALESFKTRCPNVPLSQNVPTDKWRWSLVPTIRFLFIILTADRGHLIYLHMVPYNSLILPYKITRIHCKRV
jgi:hypothetical protein